MNSPSLSSLVAGLKARHSGPNSWAALCPAHADRNPSLSIADKDGKILVRCHAGCTQESVIKALKEMGLWSSRAGKMKSAQEPSPPPKTRKTFISLDAIIDFLEKGKNQTESKIYHYPGDWGVVRVDFSKNAEKKKLIRPFHAIPGGFALGDPSGPLSLYSTRDVTVGKDDIIYVVEGEKCVDAMGLMGLPSVTSAHGAGSARKSDWTPLKGRKIDIIPDNDGPGKKYAEEVLTVLEEIDCSIRILSPYPPEATKGFDVADWLGKESPEVIKEKILATEECEKEKEKETIENWEEDLMRNEKGNLKQNTYNLLLIIENDPDFEDIRFDEFTKTTFINGEKSETPSLVRLAAKVEKKYSLPGALTERTLAPLCETVGKKRPFHPIRDWLDDLSWDGVPRLDQFLERYYGAKDSEYSRAVSRNFMIGAVARIYKPGCKLDNMVVLEGGQGLNKSSSLKALFGEEFASEVKASPDSKDFEQALQGMWCLEFAELDSLQKSDITRIKMQLSTQADWIRLPYKPNYQSFPRQSIFVGTTNDDGYLKDPTGSRRFWPVKCTQEVNIAGIRLEREQLFAEAVTRLKKGEKWWEVPPGAEEEQDLRYQHDVWEEYILPFLCGKGEITMAEIFGEECLNTKKYQSDRSMQIRVGNILKRHGWEKKRVRIGASLTYKYVPTPKIGTDRNTIGTSNTVANVPIVPIKNGDLYKGDEMSGGHNMRDESRGVEREESDRNYRNIGTSIQNQVLKDVPIFGGNVPIVDLDLFLREG